MAIPLKDSTLVAWGANFDAKATASAVTYGLTTAQATSFHTAYLAFVAAYNAVASAKAAGSRSKLLTSTKDAAKAGLLAVARQLYVFIQGNTSVLPANKLDIGVNPRNTRPSPIPPPSSAPGFDILSVNAWTVKTRIYDAASSTKKGKPLGVAGASVFSFVGATAPADLGSWKFEGNIGKTKIDVVFPNSVAPGAKVWITAYWFNNAKQSGPTCSPVSTNLQGGSVSMAA